MEKYKLWRKCKARCGQKRLSGLVQNRHANLKYMVLLKAIILIDDLIVTDNKPTTTALISHNQYILTIILMRNTVNDCWESSNLICLLGTLILWRTRRPDGLAKKRTFDNKMYCINKLFNTSRFLDIISDFGLVVNAVILCTYIVS